MLAVSNFVVDAVSRRSLQQAPRIQTICSASFNLALQCLDPCSIESARLLEHRIRIGNQPIFECAIFDYDRDFGSATDAGNEGSLTVSGQLSGAAMLLLSVQ
jgi:hypothetical protein